jgi:hypothetical protein
VGASQAEAGATLPLGGEERLEDALAQVGRDTGTVSATSTTTAAA